MLRPQDTCTRERKDLDRLWRFVLDAAARDHVGEAWYRRTVWMPRGWDGRRGHGLGRRRRGRVTIREEPPR